MTTFWPKRDEQGRHITATGERYIIGECGGPGVVEQARESAADELKEGNYTFNKVTKEWMHEDDFTPCRRCGGDGYHRDFRVQEMVSMMVCTLCDGACCE